MCRKLYGYCPDNTELTLQPPIQSRSAKIVVDFDVVYPTDDRPMMEASEPMPLADLPHLLIAEGKVTSSEQEISNLVLVPYRQ